MNPFTTLYNLLAFKAFKPLLNNTLLTLKSRLANKRLVFVAHGPGGYTVANLVVREYALPTVDVIAQSTDYASIETVFEIAKKQAKSKHAVLSVSDGGPSPFPTSSIARIPNRELNMRLATKPSDVLGHTYMTGRRYSGFFHRDMSQGLFASIGAPTLSAAVQAATNNGFQLVRTQISVIPLLDLLIADPRVRSGKFHPVILDHGVATYVPIGGAGEWLDARSRPFIGQAQPLSTFLSDIAASTDIPMLILNGGCNGPGDLSLGLAAAPNHVLFEVPGVSPASLAAVASGLN